MPQLHGDESTTRRRKVVPPAILYEDDHLLIVDKPTGLSTVPGRSGPESLMVILRESELPGRDELRLVHRLDKGTSGVLIVARTLDAQRILTEQFSQGQVRKQYLALVAGHPFEPTGTIEAPIGVRKDGSGLVRIDERHGKPSVTDWEQLETFRGGFALLACRPRTGRTHQIRVHLAFEQMPLAVDPDYGGGTHIKLSDFKTGYRPNRRRPEATLLDRLSLHAETIEFTHPATGELVTFRAELPRDLAVTLRQLRKYAS